jgi:hypothetical protein
MNFDNLVKISIKEAVKEILEISKSKNTLCEHCLQGKLLVQGQTQGSILTMHQQNPNYQPFRKHLRSK